MNVLSVEKVAFQIADSALIVGAFFGQVAVRHSEKLTAILQDQAHQDMQLTRDRLMFDSYALLHEPEVLAEDFRNIAYDALAYVFQALMLLPDFYYFMVEVFDHEIPFYLEAELKPMNVVRPQFLLTTPAIAGLLPPASEREGLRDFSSTPKTTEIQAVELPADWNLDKRGRKLSGAALQARMKKYNVSSAAASR
ncbi:hypothetical protein H6F90_00305 [Trichocoleus sp. FACHB-591]|uniref:hypothetical protein n=1 Tax=Trichocoleus sp. FACHB-591 TaxID=2692872 RepID=UPI001681E552|nr:hypothetical protein [Trichocoleus sp. FACHB-591]MBD2093596.1 hypothetical protein [Trichocoleus sp. FACHB-591]